MDVPEGWTVEVADGLGGARGLCRFRERRIVIAEGLHPWQERATLVHETVHAESGPVPVHLAAREERRVNRETARRLIPIRAFAAALQESRDADVVAGLLQVPVALVWSRWKGLHPSERHYLRRRLQSSDDPSSDAVPS